MSIAVQFNLPSPSTELINYVIDVASSTKLNVEGKYWLDQQNQIDNSAEHLFFVDESLDTLLHKEFGHLFDYSIGGLIGVMKNNSRTKYAVQPPHIDRGRALAINYYIELGGDNVVTSFYDHVDNTNSLESKNFNYNEVVDKKIGSVCFKKNQWYAFDVCRCHSIENIQNTRYFFSVYFKDHLAHYNLQNLKHDYPLMIGSNVELS